MNSKHPSWIILSCALLVTGCDHDARTSTHTGPATPAAQTDAAAPPTPDIHSSRIALDWAGTYSGVLPCADCPGIETVVTLNPDGSFQVVDTYLDREPGRFESAGTFTWNDAGSSVTLEEDGGEPVHYQVGENRLFRLDTEGKRIEGDLAPHYVLHKHVHDDRIEDRSWRLIELNGRAIDSGPLQRTPRLELQSADWRTSGNASCNRFSGGYVINDGQRIRFDHRMAVTLMACPDMSIEDEFLEMLHTTDNYSVGDDDTLSLNRARMAPLARFRPGDAQDEQGEPAP